MREPTKAIYIAAFLAIVGVTIYSVKDKFGGAVEGMKRVVNTTPEISLDACLSEAFYRQKIDPDFLFTEFANYLEQKNWYKPGTENAFQELLLQVENNPDWTLNDFPFTHDRETRDSLRKDCAKCFSNYADTRQKANPYPQTNRLMQMIAASGAGIQHLVAMRLNSSPAEVDFLTEEKNGRLIFLMLYLASKDET